MERVTLAWSGRERLWIVFWVYLVLGSAVAATLPHLAYAYYRSRFSILGGVLMIVVPFATIAYWVWVLVGTWRCAVNTQSKPCTILARIVVLVLTLGWVAAFATGASFLIHYEPGSERESPSSH